MYDSLSSIKNGIQKYHYFRNVMYFFLILMEVDELQIFFCGSAEDWIKMVTTNKISHTGDHSTSQGVRIIWPITNKSQKTQHENHYK